MMLEKRAPQTSAICATEYVWMDNGKNQSPCLIAAYALGACQGGQWTVDALSPDHHYDPPNSTTANRCSCSWTVYNLLNGCTVCQNQLASITNWSPYIQDCPRDLQSSSFWSPQITFPQDSAIPYWATQDPTKWPSARFDVSAARALAAEGRPDSVPGGPDSTAPSGPPIGAIVGGVVGGVLLIVGAAIIAFIMIRRRRARKQKEAQAYPQPPMSYNGTYVDSGHGRTFSDGSGKIPGVNDFGGYARLDTMSPTSAGGYTTSPFTTTHGHSSSMTSFSVISGPGSAVPMSPMPVSPPPLPSPAATGSSPTGGRSHGHTVGSSVGTIAELNIQPFMLPHATNMTTQFPPDSKVRPVGYDSPTSPPNGATAIPMDVAPATGPARRLNPPPYSPALNQQEGEVVTATPMRAEKSGPSSSSQTLATGRSARTHRGNQASVDTHHSRSSSRQIPGARVVGGGSVAGGSTTSGTSASAANSVVNDAATNIGEGETSYGGAGNLPGAAGVLSPVTVTSGRARDTIATGMSGVLVNQQHMGLPQVTNPDLDATPPTPSPMNHRGVDI